MFQAEFTKPTCFRSSFSSDFQTEFPMLGYIRMLSALLGRDLGGQVSKNPNNAPGLNGVSNSTGLISLNVCKRL